MHRRFSGYVGTGILLAAAAGCTTPHHSNALIFGTNTSVGLSVGQDATGVPSIVVGYRRQEAVFMPLVANAAYDANGTPIPCSIGPVGSIVRTDGSADRFPARGVRGEFVLRDIPPCLLVGQHDNAVDTYSVLASFGGHFNASARSTDPNASAGGGIAQFFATGLAAQALAIRGGSSLVAVSGAAREAASADTDAALTALYDSADVQQRRTVIHDATVSAQSAVVEYLTAHTTDANFREELLALEEAAQRRQLLTYEICGGLDRQPCIDAIGGSVGAVSLTGGSTNWQQAIQARKTARGIP
jgi:hypothetical protein